MTDQEVGTLAYFKSPKATKRTTFQDELQAAVSSRANRAKLEHYDYFDNYEDDFLNELVDSRKKRNTFKARKNKGKINNFEVSDDESTQSRRKKVSFLKSQTTNFLSNDTKAPEPLKDEPPIENSDSLSSQQSTQLREETVSSKNSCFESTEPEMTGDQCSPSYQTSIDNLPLPLPSENSVVETPSPQEKYSVVEQSSSTPATNPNNDISADPIKDKEPPKPKPRQRTFGLRSQVTEKPPEETRSQDPSGPQTSSASIPLSADTSSLIAWTDGDEVVSSPSKSSSKESQQLVQKSAWDSDSRDGLLSDENKEPEINYSSSFQEFSESSRDHTDVPCQSPEKSFHTRTSSSKIPARPRSECSKVESKYLGALKVLDRKVSLQESRPQTADSLRAAVYQEWHKKKREKSRENMQLMKKEELQKKQEKEKQEAKKEDASASYEAWKQKKGEILRAMAKERKDRAQRATQEKLEKKQSAIKMFENWKREHDHLLRDKYRKQKEAENKLKLQKQQIEEERKRDSQSAFSDWCEKKKNLLHEKLEMERKVVEYKAEEELYLKEEKEKTALQMYEIWLRKKDLEQKRRRQERRMQARLLDSQPPPWSPANRVIPSRK